MLFRALRDVEIAAGNVLIPKTQAPFVAQPRLPITIPLKLGEREEHAVREHQWSGHYPTRGISCTKNWEVALRYATNSKVIVRINEEVCEKFGIRRFRVLDFVPKELTICPEDDEVILVWDKNGALPKDVIDEVFHV